MSLLTNLVAAYTFEQSGANIGIDSLGLHNLTRNGTVPQAAGNALPGSFASSWANDGANSLSGANFIVASATDFTVTCWVYITAFQVFNLAVWNQWQSGATEMQLVLDNVTKQFFAQGSVNGASAHPNSPLDGGAAVTLNTWNFIEMYWKRSTTELSINRNNGTPVTGNLGSTIINLNQPFLIGANGVGGGFPMSGRIDGLNVWTRLLSSDERTQLYSGSAGLEYPFPGGRRRAAIICR